jgi:ankyrin repeat protein
MNLRESYIFHHAYAGRSADLSRALSKPGAVASRIDPKGNTALMAAAIGGCPACVEILLPLSDTSLKSAKEGYTALMSAALRGNDQALAALLPRSDPLAASQYSKKNALHLAAEHGHARAVEILLDWIPPSQVDATGMPPLALACRGGHGACARLLAPLTPAADFSMAHSRCPLHVACARNATSCLLEILDAHPVLPALGAPRRLTPLMVAAAHGSLECVALLLPRSNPADVDEHGSTALMEAAARGHAACIQILVQLGPLLAQNSAGKTAEQIARDRGHSHVANLLESQRVSLDISASILPANSAKSERSTLRI